MLRILLKPLLLWLFLDSAILCADVNTDMNSSEALTFFTEEGDLDLSNYLSQQRDAFQCPCQLFYRNTGFGQ